jgi:hypothetical protein
MIEQKIISGLQMKRILKLCGFSLAEFAKSINKSRSFVSHDLGKSKIVPLRYFDKLAEFLGGENLVNAWYNIDRDDPRDDEIANLKGQINTLLTDNSNLIGEYNNLKSEYDRLVKDYYRIFKMLNPGT